MKAPKPGTTVDERFLLEEEVGKGHGATMFRAQDVLLKRHVSLRWLSESVDAVRHFDGKSVYPRYLK